MRHATPLRNLLAVCALAIAVASCTAVSGRETAGEYVDDTVMTTRVKAAIFEEPSLKSLQVGVESFQNVVQLSGFVDSAESKATAGRLAANVDGVRSVRNDLVVR